MEGARNARDLARRLGAILGDLVALQGCLMRVGNFHGKPWAKLSWPLRATDILIFQAESHLTRRSAATSPNRASRSLSCLRGSELWLHFGRAKALVKHPPQAGNP
jgi:hypothetical protein